MFRSAGHDGDAFGRWFMLAAAAVLCGLGGGCGVSRLWGLIPDKAPPTLPAILLPATLAVHPFSSFYASPAPGGIEARVELQDYFGDSVKGYGIYLFEAYAPATGTVAAEQTGPRLAVWSVDLSDPQTNFDHWDRLGRTYRFHLAWQDEPPSAPAPVVLKVIFNPPEGCGERLFANKLLRPRPAATPAEPATPATP